TSNFSKSNMSKFRRGQNPPPKSFFVRREVDHYHDPQWGGGNKKILPRCARDVFCSSPFVSLRLPTDFSQNPSPSIFLLRREGDSNPRYTKRVRQFSKLLVSATHPPLRVMPNF